LTDQEYLGLKPGDTIYALEYGGESGPEIVAYVFESRATGGRIFARRPSVLKPGEDAVFRLHASSAYLTPREAAQAYVDEARRAIPYFEQRLDEAKKKLEAALVWASERGLEPK
jgi:hypothetical protein